MFDRTTLDGGRTRVNDLARTAHGAIDGFGVAQIARRDFDAVGHVGGSAPHENAQAFAAREQARHERAAHRSGGARDEDRNAIGERRSRANRFFVFGIGGACDAFHPVDHGCGVGHRNRDRQPRVQAPVKVGDQFLNAVELTDLLAQEPGDALGNVDQRLERIGVRVDHALGGVGKLRLAAPR